MRILIAEFGQETNTFSPDRIDFDALAPLGWVPGSAICESFRGTGTYLGGAVDEAEALGIEVKALDSVLINGGATMTRSCLENALSHLCAQVAEALPGADGMFLAMHGGGGAEGVEDLEVYTLSRLRAVTGRDFPIVSSLDMHGNLSQEMVDLSDGLFVIKEFPHSDMAKASALAVRQLRRMVETSWRPVMTLVPLPILLANTTTCTLFSPMKDVRDYFADYAIKHGLIDCTLVQGFSANDQYWAGVSVLIVAEEKKTREANELAQYFWERRHAFDPHPISAFAAVEQAAAYTGQGYTVINESTDNPGSGCPGDGTHLLDQLIRRNAPGSIFAFIYDPEVVEKAHAAGVGAKINVRLGGKTAPVCGEPLELEQVEVLNLSNGNFRFTGAWQHGAKSSIGRCCRLRCNNVEIVVSSVRDQTFDNGPILTTGASIDDYKIIALKSANHFRGYYQDRAAQIIPCETPGLRPTDLRQYPYRHIRRPIYPLDEDAAFVPLQ